MKTKNMILAVVLAIAAIAAQTALAALPSFTYQGVVQNLDGTPLTGNQVVEFRLYDVAVGGNALWGRARSVLLDANGLFNTELSDEGSVLPNAQTVGLAKVLADKANVTLYLGITVQGSSGEISPRQALLAAPYAIHASDALKASGDFNVAGTTKLHGALTVDGSVTMNDITAQTASFNSDVTSAGQVKANSFEGFGVVPLRCILMWSGTPDEIPSGWALCNGQSVNGITTPDLSGKFIVGIDTSDRDYYYVGRTGGEKKHQLTVAEIPSHKHNNVCSTMGYTARFNGDKEVVTYDGHKSNGTEYIQGSLTGDDQPHENRPPYYTICFIMRVK